MCPIGLDEMKGIKLMNRIDTKYLTTETELVRILEAAREDYRVQEILGQRISSYDTIYFDTADFDMYLAHHNRRSSRQKIRTRSYVDSGDTFLEIKNKNNRGRTKKVRIPISGNDLLNFTENLSARDFISNKSNYPLEKLEPRVRTRFERITLVNNEKTERLTIDMGLRFENLHTGEGMSLPGVVIIELKQDGAGASPMKDILLDERVKPRRMSKYCIGTVLTVPDIRKNRFKENLNYINKLNER